MQSLLGHNCTILAHCQPNVFFHSFSLENWHYTLFTLLKTTCSTSEGNRLIKMKPGFHGSDKRNKRKLNCKEHKICF